MKTLDITPPRRWIKFDEELSLEVRRVQARELMDMFEGTSLGRMLYAIDPEDPEVKEAKTSLPEMMDLAERVFERMVTDWTVQDPEGVKLPVTLDAARWLMTEVKGLAEWVVLKVLLPARDLEAEIDTEKKD